MMPLIGDEGVGVNSISSDEVEEEVNDTTRAKNKGVEMRLWALASLNGIYCVLQLFAAVGFHSLALLSDAFHNLSDVAAVLLAVLIHRLQESDPKSDRLPYGYRRADVVGGFGNSIALLALSTYVILSAIPRLLAPEESNVTVGFVLVALAGVLVNAFGMVFFCGHSGGGGGGGDEGDGGLSMAHSHSHSHGHSHGHGHGHGHGPWKKRYAPLENGTDDDEEEDDDVEMGSFISTADKPMKSSKALTPVAGPMSALAPMSLELAATAMQKSFVEDDPAAGAGGDGGGGSSHEAAGRRESASGDDVDGNDDSGGGCAKGKGTCFSSKGEKIRYVSGGDSYGGHGDGHDYSRGHGHHEHGHGHHEHSHGDNDCDHSHDHAHSHAHIHDAEKHGSHVDDREDIDGHNHHRHRHHGGGGGGGGGGCCGERRGGCGSKNKLGCSGAGRINDSNSSSSHRCGGSKGNISRGDGGGCDAAHSHGDGCGDHFASNHTGGAGHECSRMNHGDSSSRGIGGGGGGSDGDHVNMNLWAVFLHCMADSLMSAAVAVIGILIILYGDPDRIDWTDYLDPVASLLLSVFIAAASWPVIRASAHVLLEGTPEGFDLTDLTEAIQRVQGVIGVDRLVITQLNSGAPFAGTVKVRANLGECHSHGGGKQHKHHNHDDYNGHSHNSIEDKRSCGRKNDSMSAIGHGDSSNHKNNNGVCCRSDVANRKTSSTAITQRIEKVMLRYHVKWSTVEVVAAHEHVL